jgi:copper oxidase (laccase) domain-containing protein
MPVACVLCPSRPWAGGSVPRHGKVFVDLRSAVRTRLRALGLSDNSIEDVPDRTRAGCTRCDAQRFHSHRRDGDASGRLVGVIVAR